MPDARLDTLVHAETPEGLQLALRPAGLAPRAYALLLDWIIRIIVFSVAAGFLARIGGIGMGVYLIFYFLLEWFYPVAFELTTSGATPGKRMLNLRVIMDNGLPITPGASLVRNLLRVADFMPLAFGFGIVSMLWRSDFKRLGDLAAGTLVVYRSRTPGPVRLPDVAPLQPVVDLANDAQAAVVSLAARASRLTAERVEELASLVPESVLPNGVNAAHSKSQRAFGLARWLVGHRPG